MNGNRLTAIVLGLLTVAVLALGWLLGVAPKLAEAAASDTERLLVEAQNINAKLKINSSPSNRNSALSPDAPKFSEMKLIDYDTPRWGSPAERSRLLKKFDAEVKSQPR